GPPKESAMSHVRKAALPLLAVALGAALAACSRNEQAADAATTPVAAPEATPAAEPAGDNVHAFQIGTLQAAALRDGGLAVRHEQAPGAAAPPVAAPDATPAAEPAGVNVHACQGGTLQAAALRDGGMSVPNDNNVFGVGLTPDEVAGVLAAAGLETAQLT